MFISKSRFKSVHFQKSHERGTRNDPSANRNCNNRNNRNYIISALRKSKGKIKNFVLINFLKRHKEIDVSSKTISLCLSVLAVSEKVQTLLVLGGLVNRILRISPFLSYRCLRLSLSLSPFVPVVDLTVTSYMQESPSDMSPRADTLRSVCGMCVSVYALVEWMFILVLPSHPFDSDNFSLMLLLLLVFYSFIHSFIRTFLFVYPACHSCPSSAPLEDLPTMFIKEICEEQSLGWYSMRWLSGPHWVKSVHS